MASISTPPLALNIRLSKSARQKLVKQAASAGKPLDAFASQLLERAANAPDVDAILAPLRKEFAASGTTDEQLVDQINEARNEDHGRRPKAKRK